MEFRAKRVGHSTQGGGPKSNTKHEEKRAFCPQPHLSSKGGQSNPISIQSNHILLPEGKALQIHFNPALLPLSPKPNPHSYSFIQPKGAGVSGCCSDLVPNEDGPLQVFEGARNNLPDDNSLAAATAIVSLMSRLQETDLLIVLISGLQSPTSKDVQKII